VPLLYFYFDPFKVLYKYDTFFESDRPNYVNLNKDYVSTQNLLNKYKKSDYEAFILGNSRSIFYEVGMWSDYINIRPAQCYHFDASGENLFGVTQKIQLLDRLKIPVKHILIVVDPVLLSGTEDQKEYFKIKHPELSDKSALRFHLKHFTAFSNYTFFSAFVDFKLGGKIKPYMLEKKIFDSLPFHYDPVTNEIQMRYLEKKIKKDSLLFYAERRSFFYTRPAIEKMSDPVLYEKQKKMLRTIQDYANINNVSIKIVISPLYDQLRIDKTDLNYLEQLFGKSNVFDFSGKNNFTENVGNYYEDSHYRPHVAQKIMEYIYADTR
jgi:hypothetical protein